MSKEKLVKVHWSGIESHLRCSGLIEHCGDTAVGQLCFETTELKQKQPLWAVWIVNFSWMWSPKLYKSKCGGELKLSTTSNMVLLCWVKSRHRCHSSSSERHLKKVQCCSKSEKCAIYICVRVYHSKSCRTVPAKSIWRSLSMWTVSSLCHVSTGGGAPCIGRRTIS